MTKQLESRFKADGRFKFDTVLPGLAYSVRPHRGTELVDLKSLGIIPGMVGGDRGYNATADLLTHTLDGRDLNEMWAEYQSVIQQWNAERANLVRFLTYSVTNPIEEIPIVGQDGDFEEASEYGEPVGIRPSVDYWSLGFDFKWYDLAARFTWQFLADAPSSQLDATQNAALEADSRLVFTKVFRQIFNGTNRMADIRGNPYNVYTFYNAAGQAPPNYKTYTFDGTHTHYLRSGAATIDPGDLQDQIEHLLHHGYDQTRGYKLVTMVNRTEAEVIRLFRSGVNGATYDFVPAQGTPALLLPVDQVILGQQVSNTLNGLKVIGSYGPLVIVEEDYIPTKYVFSFATGGPDSLQNPIGIREHSNQSLRGMRLVKGRTPDYPLIDSFYIRGMGTGVRHRGAGVVTQIATGSGYAAPAAYA